MSTIKSSLLFRTKRVLFIPSSWNIMKFICSSSTLPPQNHFPECVWTFFLFHTHSQWKESLIPPAKCIANSTTCFYCMNMKSQQRPLRKSVFGIFIFIKVEECLRFFTVMILQSDCKENKKHINHDLISTVFENTNILYIFNDSRSLSTKNCLISSKSLISPTFCAISSQFC